MNRKEFLKKGSLGCLGIVTCASLLSSCAGTKYLTGVLNDQFLEVPLSEFELVTKKETKQLKYLVVQHERLEYPICVYRDSDTQYHALLMKCTHQGTELQAFGDRLQCPAHGSEFTSTGLVQNGPADSSLRTFPVKTENELLKIDLS